MSEAVDRLHRSLAQARHWISIDRSEKALAALSDAGPAAADVPDTYLLQAVAHLQLGRRHDAREAAERGLALDPGNPTLFQLLGVAHWERGDRPAAERAFLDGLSHAPENPHLLARYAMLVAEDGQIDKARRLAERAAARGPEDPFVARVRSLIAYLDGDDKTAQQIGAAALAGSPENAGLHALMGSYLLESGAIGRGTKHHLTSASIDPGDAGVRELGWQAKYLRHPLMRPLWFVDKFGPGKIWLAWLVVFFTLRSAGAEEVAAVLALAYLVFVVYSWVVPPILRRRYRIRS